MSCSVCVQVKSLYSCPTLCNSMDCSLPRLLCPVGFSRQEYWSGWPCPSSGIFPTQGSNPGLLYCGQILYCLSHQGSPRILEWVVYPFSRGIFQTQELNWGLLNCRQILYQLNYQGLNHAVLPPRVTELSGIVCPGTIWPQTFPILISAF